LSDIDDSIPSDFEAEQAVLGSMMLSATALAECMEILKPADFARPAHGEIFAAISALSGRGGNADAITVKAELERRGTILKTGGAPYLHTLIAAVPFTASAAWYATRVRDCAVRWRLAEAAASIRDTALRGDADITDRINAAYKVLDEAAGTAIPPGAKSLADLIGPALEIIENGPAGGRGIPTGWADLDDLIPGFRPGQLVTVGGRPGMGKSIVLLNVAVHAGATLGLPVLVCTLEMSSQECIERILSCQASVGLRNIREGSMNEAEWSRIGGAFKHLSACGNLLINDDPYMSIQGIRSDLRAMRRAGMPARMVVVDYLGLMRGSGAAASREREISEFSRSLKLLAKEFGVPVLVGSQLNRGPEMRTDHKPLPADLRDSGSVEQDSDIVILLYREDAYEQESPRSGEIDLIVAKNRQGPQGTVTLAFRGHYSMCADMYRPTVQDTLEAEAA
jgi:replicative DNA helicase